MCISLVQRCFKAQVFGPALSVVNLSRGQHFSGAHRRGKVHTQTLDQLPSVLCDDGARREQRIIPCKNLRPWRLTTDGGIALPQRLLIPAPMFGERMFHVEQGPIHESPPNLRAVIHEPMQVGAQNQGRQAAGHLFSAQYFALLAGFKSASAITKLQQIIANSVRVRDVQCPFTIAVPAGDLAQVLRSERASATCNVERF